ncbi:MAG: hypothetical protein Q9166_000441 [cf. Caloplaca sp. 2 TL-2023]
MHDELDDLFGEQQLGEIPNLSNLSTLPRGLIQRIDDLRVSGCSQKITWSNAGCIASITSDGSSVILRNLYCDPATGLWTLSDGDDLGTVTMIHTGHTLKHLSWNHSGTELAVADTLGNISVFSLLVSINRCSVSRRCVLGAEDNLSAIVGLTWLNQDRQLLLHGPAVKNPNGQWAFTGSRLKHAGPHNPHVVAEQSSRNKPALVVVTKASIVRILYQGPDGARWLEFKGGLDDISIAADLLTHAAICAETDQSMLVATHSVSKHIRTYRIKVDWSKQSFVVDRLRTIVDCSPKSNALIGSRLPSTLPYPEPALYHLEIVSPTSDIRIKETIPPLLLAVFASTPKRNEHPSSANDISTSIVRWELCTTRSSLHPSFSQLASKKPNSTGSDDLQSDVVFKRLQDINIHKVIVTIRELHLATAFVLCFSDGSVEFRNRSTLDLLPRDDTPDRVSSMAQVGLEFLPGDPSVPEAVAEACIMQFNMSCNGYGIHHDDLSATMQVFHQQHLKDRRQQAQTFVHTFLNDMYRILQLNVDYTGDTKTEIYLKNVLYQKALSMQLSLGYSGEQQHRTSSSKLAFAVLQLRWAALTFALGLKPNPPGAILPAEAELNRTETVRSFFGIISWTLSLVNFIVDELLTILTEVEENGTMDHDGLEARMQVRNTPALALLFVSQSRLLFKYNIRFFRGINAEATQSRAQNPTWRELGTIFSSSPLPPHLFEKIIADVEMSIRRIYESSQIPDSERREMEKTMLISGSVPSKLWPAVESLFMKTLKTMRGDINRAELFFHDISWIGLSDDKASDQWRKEHRLDIVRKVEVAKRAKIRQCTRCCFVMEDAAPPRGAMAWLVNMWRSCVCGNWWMDMEKSDETENALR